MSTLHSKRPRRSFATRSTHSTSSQHIAGGLRYDGEEVPVLIRLPDLSPQALLRESASTSARTAPSKRQPNVPKPKQSIPSAASPPAATSRVAEPKARPATAGQSSDEPSTGKPSTGKPSTGKPATGKPAAGNPSTGNPSRTTNVDSTPATAEGSSRRKRRRRRKERKGNGDQLDKVWVASQHESKQGETQRTAPTATSIRRNRNISFGQNRNIRAFDKSHLLIVVSLVFVAGLTYYALRGTSEDPAEPAGAWGAGEAGSVVNTVEQASDPEADLWPTDQDSQVSDAESTLAHQTDTSSEATATTPAAGPVWPTQPGQEPAESYDPATTPVDDFTYSGPLVAAPSNGPSNTAPISDGPISGWPTESSTQAQPSSATGPIDGWPKAALAPPNTDLPTGSSNGYDSSQGAADAISPSLVGGFPAAPTVRTGRLETGPYSGGSINTAANSGSHLNGTIEIPRPRANNENNGSNVY